MGALASLAALALAASGGPLLNDAATIGAGGVMFGSATHFGIGFAGYDGGNGTGPAMGQSVELAFGAASFLQVGLRLDLAYNGDQCPNGPSDPTTCYTRTFLSGALKAKARILRLAGDRVQLGVEASEAVLRLPGASSHVGFETTVGLALSVRFLDQRVLPFLRVGYDYKYVPAVGSWSDGPVFALGAELALGGRVHPYLEASLGVPHLRWQDGRDSVFCLAAGLTANLL